jgi:transcriptional regulator GlxA family with amidase domain
MQSATQTVVIRVRGRLSSRLTAAFEGLTAVHRCGVTDLVGPLADQAQLFSLLTRIRDLGLTLESAKVMAAPYAGPSPDSPDALGIASSRVIGIVLFDDVEELDVVGPWEVLSWWTRHHPEDGYTLVGLSPDGGPVQCARGLSIGADLAIAHAPALDVLVQPGGNGTRALIADEAYLAWVRQRGLDVPLMTSVCTGSLVYAAAGLLRGRPATTYWDAFDELTALDPTIVLRPDDRFVDDGDVITAAGVSAGIDMALHLVARLAGVERAQQVRRGIQYDPQPPV